MTKLKHRRILRLPKVIEKTGLERDTVYRGAREGWFPKSFKLSPTGRASGWFEDEIDEYLERRGAERDKPAAARPTDPPRRSARSES